MNKEEQILQSTLSRLSKYNGSKHILAGFDGFVDEIIHVVDKRINHEKYERIPDIKAFSERIAAGAGLSANIELVTTQTKLGGNGPIMANALIAQGQKLSYIGAIGRSFIHPVFRDFADSCSRVISLCEPAHTDALEFLDGKIMLGKIDTLVDVNMDNLLKKISKKDLEALLAQTDLVAFTNWTMLARLNEIMEGFGDIIRGLEKKPAAFIDLADPKKRTTVDIEGILKLISEMPCETVLSMNLSESSIIASVLGISEENVLSRARKIRNEMGISAIVIHPTHGAAISHEAESIWIEGPFTKTPVLTTGAGDNFNAGFCKAWLAGFTPGECIMAGVCTSGYYVRNAKSPTRSALLGFMEQWLAKGCGVI